MNADIATSISYANSQRFHPDARVAGVLVNADIGPISYGELHCADRAPGTEFVRFEAVGLDSRLGWQIVKSAAGVAYVIVTFAEHTKKRGVGMLQEHIAANPAWYAERLKSTWRPNRHLV